MLLPEIKINKILFATDLSESALYAFGYAQSIANLYGAGITILHVLMESPNIDSKMAIWVGGDRWEQIKQRNLESARQSLIGKKRDNSAIREALLKFCETAQDACEGVALVPDEILVERGNPADQILQQAADHECDLIVIASHGHGALQDVVMGGTANRVLRRSKIPVLMVPLQPQT